MTTSRTAQKKFPIGAVIGAIGALVLITVVIMTFDTGGSGEFGTPVVTGQVLPPLPDGSPDPAVGLPIPDVVGADFDGNKVAITNDGQAKILLFLAHWCPHCQAEVPVVKQWLDEAPLPANVAIYTIATSISATRPNYPPSKWLDREGWNAPVIVDDELSTIGGSFGLTAFPYWVFTATDGTVLARLTGEVPPSSLDTMVATLTGGG